MKLVDVSKLHSYVMNRDGDLRAAGKRDKYVEPGPYLNSLLLFFALTIEMSAMLVNNGH